MVTAPDRAQLTGSRSILPTPGREVDTVAERHRQHIDQDLVPANSYRDFSRIDS
jgi:hypothetical protein